MITSSLVPSIMLVVISRRVNTGQEGAFVLLVQHRIDVRAALNAAFRIIVRHRQVVIDEVLVRIQMRIQGHGVNQLGRARDQDIVSIAIRHHIQQAGFPIGGINAELDRVGLDIEFVSDVIHAALGAIEERLVAERAIDHQHHPQRILGDGGESRQTNKNC